MTDATTIERYSRAIALLQTERFTLAEENAANLALRHLFDLRDMLVWRDADGLAGEVDDILGRLERLSRNAVRPLPSGDAFGPGSHASHGAADSVSALRVSIPIAGERP